MMWKSRRHFVFILVFLLLLPLVLVKILVDNGRHLRERFDFVL